MYITKLAIILIAILILLIIATVITKCLTLRRLQEIDGFGGVINKKEEHHTGKVISKSITK